MQVSITNALLMITVIALFIVIFINRAHHKAILIRDEFGHVEYELPKPLLASNSTWDTSSTKLPLDIGDARKIAGNLAQDLESVIDYVKWSLCSIGLVPIGKKDLWCYVVTLEGVNNRLGSSGPPLRFNAMILLDGTVIVPSGKNFVDDDPKFTASEKQILRCGMSVSRKMVLGTKDSLRLQVNLTFNCSML